MREFRIIRITELKVKADSEEDAIQKCKDNKADSEQTKYVRFMNWMGEKK